MVTRVEPTTSTSTSPSRVGHAALAVILFGLLGDAAVETFVSGSPVRWWVGGIVAAYVAIAVFLWRRRPSKWHRFGWSARASASFFLLLALLTLTAWLPGGLSDGIRLLGQPTSRVLSLLTAVVIGLAGACLVRLSWLPRWAKVAIGLITAYGLAAFVKGIISGTEFAALLHGGSLWIRLPFWLQGAFLGAFIVVPAGLLLHVAHLLRSTPSVSRAWDLRQVIAMAMSVLLVISGVANSAYGGPQPSAAEIVQLAANSYDHVGDLTAEGNPKTPPTPQQVADKLESLFPMLEKADREIPRDTFDLQAVMDRVGKDPQKLFEWVRDNTYFVPYRGLLRGDKGVLMDRLGNSLDRAMLLYAMLRNIGQPARLAHGTLTEAQAKDVLKKVRPFPSFGMRTSSASSSIAPDAFIRQYAGENHLDGPRLRKAVDEVTTRQRRAKELVQKRVVAQAAIIAAAVGHPPKRILAEEHASQVRAVTDHWWVEWQNDGSWMDFDPTLPDAQPGKTLTAVRATAAPNSYIDLGEDLLHTVQIQVVIEVWKRGQVNEIPVLTQNLVPADLIGEYIVLRQIPVSWPQHLNLFEEKNPLERFKQVVLAQTEWLPVLSVGSQNVSRYSFNDYGDLGDATLPGYIQNVMAGKVLAHKEEEAVEGLGKTIGGILGGSQANQQQSTQQTLATRSEVTAEWLDYSIGNPGQTVRRIRREIFDLIGPAGRSAKPVPPPEITDGQRLERGLKLLGESEIVPLVCQLSSEFIQHSAIQNALANRDALLGFTRMAAPSLTDLAGKLTNLPGQLYLLALARRGWSRFREEIYLDRPNILSYYKHLALNAKGEVAIREGYDIVANEVAVHATRGTDASYVRLEQGLLDTNAEAVLATARCRILEENPSCGQIENTAELFATASRKPGIRWAFIESARDPAWKQIAVSKDVRARVEQDLLAGYAVLIPKESVRGEGNSFVSWWRVNPRTWDTLGVGQQGGQTATEVVLHLLPGAVGIVWTAVCWSRDQKGACNPCWRLLYGMFLIAYFIFVIAALMFELEMAWWMPWLAGGDAAVGAGLIALDCAHCVHWYATEGSKIR